MKLVASGKVKDVYEASEETLLFRFSDRISAFDVKFDEEIPGKGRALCRFAEFWFDELDIPNHFLERRGEREILVKKMQMLPIECVVRGYFYGSLVSRWRDRDGGVAPPELAEKLPEPIFDPTTKSAHDIPVSRDAALRMGLVSEDQFEWLSANSVKIYRRMAGVADAAGFILADLKLEFGILGDKIVLGDSIGPDEYRLWPKSGYAPGRVQQSYDKQILRDWLVSGGYPERFEEDRRAGREPAPPRIPAEIVSRISERYAESYEMITGGSL